MSGLFAWVKKYNALLIFTLNFVGIVVLLGGAYQVKLLAETALQMAQENKQSINVFRSEYNAYLRDNESWRLQVQSLQSELQNTREAANRLEKSLSEIQAEFVKKGISTK